MEEGGGEKNRDAIWDSAIGDWGGAPDSNNGASEGEFNGATKIVIVRNLENKMAQASHLRLFIAAALLNWPQAGKPAETISTVVESSIPCSARFAILAA